MSAKVGSCSRMRAPELSGVSRLAMSIRVERASMPPVQSRVTFLLRSHQAVTFAKRLAVIGRLFLQPPSFPGLIVGLHRPDRRIERAMQYMIPAALGGSLVCRSGRRSEADESEADNYPQL